MISAKFAGDQQLPNQPQGATDHRQPSQSGSVDEKMRALHTNQFCNSAVAVRGVKARTCASVSILELRETCRPRNAANKMASELPPTVKLASKSSCVNRLTPAPAMAPCTHRSGLPVVFRPA